MLILLLLLVSTVTCVDNSLTCTLCQLSTSFMYRENTTEAGVINVAELREQCKQLPDCHHSMTDCELVTHLSSFPLTDEQIEEYRSFLFVTRLLTAKCMFEPDSEVIEDFEVPGFLYCPICKLLYKQFGKINNGLHGKDVTITIDLAKVVCGILRFEGQPNICGPISDGALDAIVRGVEDSLGPFYNAVGKIFGCDTYDTLFDDCPY